jgi:dipeptidyl aminopeptidase/acylaminoacyl peptidase
MKIILLCAFLLTNSASFSQNVMTPELLWSLNRVNSNVVSADGKNVFYSVKKYDLETEKSKTTEYVTNISTGKKSVFKGGDGKVIFQQNADVWYASDQNFIFFSTDEGLTWNNFRPIIKDAENVKISPNGKYIAYTKEVLVSPTLGKDIYKDLDKTTAQIYTDLNYRHWDKWSDGKFSHLFIENIKGGDNRDLLLNMPYDCPQKPHGGAEDFVWNPNSESIVYVCKKKFGKDYAQSTNTDLYEYNIKNNVTNNLTEGMMGYDMNPSFSPNGRYIAYTSMKTDGFEADKNDLIIMDLSNKFKRNMTSQWDETVGGFKWSSTGYEIYFTAPWKGTEQVFSLLIPNNLMAKNLAPINQLTSGDFDVTGIIGENKNDLIITRTDMNHATEIFAASKENGKMIAITHENDAIYEGLKKSKIEKRFIKTTDGKEMFAWVIYPPDFNPLKKYPTLLYCQGGPQGALSQFYSYRWNFQLMAAKGYIIIAPNRRGMPGWGVKWNADISKDWGGQAMDDYLSAIDDLSKEKYVDKNRIGCVGASYGGYSVFMLAGIHNNRFKSFISHCGLFDLKSWYGTTEELWFANWDIGGNYWQNDPPKSYAKFSPSNFVDKWNTPIMIIQGGLDFRVPIEQGQQAFQAAQLKGIKSKFLYFPNENHWVMHAQNGILWQREFFKWLEETLK